MILPCEANFFEIFTSIFDVNENYILTCSFAVSGSQTGPFSPVKATVFHQQTVSRATQDREAERHDEDQQVHDAPVRNKKGNKTTCSSFKCSFNRSY